MKNQAKLNRRRWAVQLALTTGLVLLFLAVLLWGLQGVIPARADPGDLYVDGASGQDIPTCGTINSPCQTISYTLNTRASAGDTIRVAQGVYTENLTININVTLAGGYEAVEWTRSITQYETILDGSNGQAIPGDWDENQVGAPVVISTGVVYEMWYEGWPTDGAGQLGRATSTDGEIWTKDTENPLFSAGAPGAWDEGSVTGPSLLLDDGTYKIWYTASRHPTSAATSRRPNPSPAAGPEGAYPFATGYATSTDGITWARQPEPVLEAGAAGAWDRSGIRDPSVIKNNGSYEMWYHAWTDITGQIGCATSPDGINWTKSPANPVFGPGNPGDRLKTGLNDWDQTGVKSPVVLFHDGIYHMWYVGTGDPFPDWTWHIGYVTSTNGITWSRFLTAPVLSGTGGEWDEGSVSLGDVFFDGETYHMWYGANGQIGYAWSSDGISWTKSSNNPVLTPGEPGQPGQPVVTFESDSDGALLDGFTITCGKAQEAGGVHAGNADVTIRSCLIRDNFADGSPTTWGGGGVLAGASLTIMDSRIINNQVNQGASGVRVGQGHLTMVNTIVADNQGAEGFHLNGTADLMNVTVANNAIGTGRPGINFNPQTGGNLVVVNSIIYGNGTGDAFHVPDPDTIQTSYSVIEGGWPGADNLDADPLFVDAINGDYYLQAGSPCIDKGTSVGAPPADIEGTPRDASPDMGAYEWTGFRIFLPLILRNVVP